MSLPSRKRGLKYFILMQSKAYHRSLPSRKRGLKSYHIFTYCRRHHSRFLRGSVDWNPQPHRAWVLLSRRFLRGSVDWNQKLTVNQLTLTVASFAEAWIEIIMHDKKITLEAVASFAEAWIEITYTVLPTTWSESLPSRKRGLKSRVPREERKTAEVASFAEAWIEIHSYWRRLTLSPVASFAEAWIEIQLRDHYHHYRVWSLPSRKRGLKSFSNPQE